MGHAWGWGKLCWATHGGAGSMGHAWVGGGSCVGPLMGAGGVVGSRVWECPVPLPGRG